MINRNFWQKEIEKSWQERSIIWLSGVRRVGKTCLSQSLSNIEYFDCELPRIRRMMEDPEEFLNSISGQRIVLDEVNRLGNLAHFLKSQLTIFLKQKFWQQAHLHLGHPLNSKTPLQEERENCG